MTTISLYDYEELNNKLKNIPRSRVHQFCKEHGVHSWHNAQKAPNYSKWRHLAR